MAPSTPPPPRIARLAALTTASTSCCVMSPWTTESSMAPFYRSSRSTARSSAACRSSGGAVAAAGGRGDGAALLVLVDHPRVDVGLAREGRGVAEELRDLLHRRRDRPLARRLRLAGLVGLGQRDRCQHGRVPGPEVLGRVVGARRPPDVLVDDAASRARATAGPPSRPAAARRRAGARMTSSASMTAGSSISISCSIPDLPTKRNTSRPCSLRTCRRSQGGEAEAAVLVGVDVVADPEVAEVEQPDRDGARPVAAHPAACRGRR